MEQALVHKISLENDTISRTFELEITKEAPNCHPLELEKMIQDQSLTTNERFIAFFLLVTHYRKLPNFNAMRQSFVGNKHLFSENDYPLLRHIELLVSANKPYDKFDFYNLVQESRRLASLDVFKEQAGVLHHFAELTARYFELNEEQIEDNLDLINEAKDASDKTIQLSLANKYAKFYATQGRLLSLLGKYDEAFTSFDLALALENPEANNYQLIVSRYQDYQNNVRQLRLNDKLKKQVSLADEEIQKLKGNNFKILGVFAGFVTFIIGNISFVTSGDRPLDLMIVFNGMFFTYFGLLMILMQLMMPDIMNKKKRFMFWLLTSLMTLSGIALTLVFYLT